MSVLAIKISPHFPFSYFVNYYSGLIHYRWYSSLFWEWSYYWYWLSWPGAFSVNFGDSWIPAPTFGFRYYCPGFIHPYSFRVSSKFVVCVCGFRRFSVWVRCWDWICGFQGPRPVGTFPGLPCWGDPPVRFFPSGFFLWSATASLCVLTPPSPFLLAKTPFPSGSTPVSSAESLLGIFARLSSSPVMPASPFSPSPTSSSKLYSFISTLCLIFTLSFDWHPWAIY